MLITMIGLSQMTPTRAVSFCLNYLIDTLWIKLFTFQQTYISGNLKDVLT